MKPLVGILRVINPAWESLASTQKRVLRPGGETHRTKRRQQVPKPCDGAPKLPLAWSLRRCLHGGHVGASRRPDASVLPGSENRAKAQRIPQEPGIPSTFPCDDFRERGPDDAPWPAVWRLGPTGAKRQTQRVVLPSEGNQARRKRRRESHISIVPLKQGNLYRGDPGKGRGMSVKEP